MVEYDILEDIFVDHGQFVLNYHVYGYSQYYTQYDQTTMYTIDFSGDYLIMFNLESLESQQMNTTIPVNVDSGGLACIVSSEVKEALYIVGGHDDSSRLATVQTFQLDSQTWLTNVADMNAKRFYHGCLVEETTQRLYVVGGLWEKSIEYIDFTNIESESWVTLNDELPVNLHDTRLVAVNGIIYTIGGQDLSANEHDTMYTIDAATGNLSIHSDVLPTAMTGIAAIVVDNVIYGFGGLDVNNVRANWWMTYGSAPTANPTSEPTANPTKYPTAGPTTAGPTVEPTTGPTIEPTPGPTAGPTGTPTDVETIEMIEFGYSVVSVD